VNFSKGVLIYYSESKKKVISMVLKLQCPECGKGEKSDLLEVLPDRKYRMKCGDCGCAYILTVNVDEERKCDKSSDDR
jgi:ribosomal protein S27AE